MSNKASSVVVSLHSYQDCELDNWAGGVSWW